MDECKPLNDGLAGAMASEWGLTRGGGRRTPLPPLTRPTSHPLSLGARATTGGAIVNAVQAETTANEWGLKRGGQGHTPLPPLTRPPPLSAPRAPSYREWLLARGGGRLTRTADEDTIDAL
jgi:hypothetical protein